MHLAPNDLHLPFHLRSDSKQSNSDQDYNLGFDDEGFSESSDKKDQEPIDRTSFDSDYFNENSNPNQKSKEYS